MTIIDLPYLNPQYGRDGTIRHWYFRRRNCRWPLPGDPPSEAFMAEYRRLLKLTQPGVGPAGPVDRGSYGAGSFGRLVSEYLASGNFKQRKPRTAAGYRRILEALQREHGDKPVALLQRHHVRKMRDACAETPGEANNILRMLKVILNFAIEEGWIEASPAAKMKLLKVGEWRAWTDEECARFEQRWAPGTMQRRAYALALYSGMRKRDQITRTRNDRQDGGILVVQSKTGKELWIPEHRELTAELARGVATFDTLLVTPTQGRPFDENYFGSWCAKIVDQAGLPADCVWHGLRKAAARKLAELGLSEETIKSITGHISSPMVAKYVKDANQRKLAKAAMRAWENAE
jgi:integrase